MTGLFLHKPNTIKIKYGREKFGAMQSYLYLCLQLTQRLPMIFISVDKLTSPPSKLASVQRVADVLQRVTE